MKKVFIFSAEKNKKKKFINHWPYLVDQYIDKEILEKASSLNGITFPEYEIEILIEPEDECQEDDDFEIDQNSRHDEIQSAAYCCKINLTLAI